MTLCTQIYLGKVPDTEAMRWICYNSYPVHGIFIQVVQSGTFFALAFGFVGDCKRWKNSCRNQYTANANLKTRPISSA